MRRSVSIFAAVCLLAALVLPTLAIAQDRDHADCRCPKGACFCHHGKPLSAAERACSRTAKMDARGCGNGPATPLQLGPKLPDVVLEVAGGIVSAATPVDFLPTRISGVTPFAQPIDTPPPKA